MFRRSICLVLIILALGAAGSARADLIGWWRLDGDASDSSVNGNDGVLFGGPQWVDGKIGGALEFDGADDRVEMPGTSAAEGFAALEGEVTWAAWFKTPGGGLNPIMVQDPPGAAHVSGNRSLNVESSGMLRIRANGVGPLNDYNSNAAVNDNQWHHVAVTIAFEANGENDAMKLYIDGDLSQGYEIDVVNINLQMANASDFIIVLGRNGNNSFTGLIDDVRVYDQVLSEEEILFAMTGGGGGNPQAGAPDPADGELYENTWANLTWRAGFYAVTHDLYFGTSFDDVNDGAEGTYVGNMPTTSQIVGIIGFPAAEGLQPGTTYYWRVDEVNDANSASPWKGNVWSFSVPSRIAYEPHPVDGGKFIATDVTLNWTPGFGANLHSIYFGDNADEVANAVGAPPQTEVTFTPPALELEKTYYWRVDEFDGVTTLKGDVWSFTTLPLIEMTDDPNFVGWWKLDEGIGNTAVDYSGHGHHGTVYGDPSWVDGYDVGAMQFGGADRIEMPGTSASDGYAAVDGEVSWTAWFKTAGSSVASTILAQGPAGAAHVRGNRSVNVEASGVIMVRGNSVGDLMDFGSTGIVNDDQWHHVAVTIAFDTVEANDTMKVYIDGDLGAGYEVDTIDINLHGGAAGDFIFTVGDRAGTPFIGLIDDVRVYDRILTQDEVVMIMRIDPLLAWEPIPISGSMPDIESVMPLVWSPGDSAASHEVYFGTDSDAVKNADTSDTTGVYRGSQNGTSFTPAEGIEWGGGPYYWRIDENNTDGTVTTGRIWSFTVADFLLVDDFESYTDDDPNNEAIWQHWIDGYGIPANGSQSGHEFPPYAEQTTVHGGTQSMPLTYDNTAGVRNSEAVLTLVESRDWTRHGVGALSLWFRGYPPSVGSFTQGAGGTITMTGAGSDIWDAADHFHFAYKTLTGAGSIVARIDSVQNTHAWSKAGVMIRESLEPGSTHAFACVTPGSGVASQGRTDTDGSSFSTNETGITAPHWVKLERDVAGNFSVSHSTNGSTWLPVADSVPVYIPMTSEVYVGLALTSHDDAQTCEATFSNVTITGNAGMQWMNQDIGILANAAEPLYVSLSNANAAPVVTAHDNPDAATITEWIEWVIDLQAFADQGVNLADVDKIAIGLGATGDPAATGGSGRIFIDDIRLIRPIAP